jgi:hypothetical protein
MKHSDVVKYFYLRLKSTLEHISVDNLTGRNAIKTSCCWKHGFTGSSTIMSSEFIKQIVFPLQGNTLFIAS